MLLDLIGAAARVVTRIALALLGGALIALVVVAASDRIVAAVAGGA